MLSDRSHHIGDRAFHRRSFVCNHEADEIMWVREFLRVRLHIETSNQAGINRNRNGLLFLDDPSPHLTTTMNADGRTKWVRPGGEQLRDRRFHICPEATCHKIGLYLYCWLPERIAPHRMQPLEDRWLLLPQGFDDGYDSFVGLGCVGHNPGARPHPVAGKSLLQAKRQFSTNGRHISTLDV